MITKTTQRWSRSTLPPAALWAKRISSGDSVDLDVAEVAFGVIDAWQGRGVGTCLADRLVRRARELGVGRLRATVFAENRRVKALLRRQGSVIDTRFDGAEVELLVALS